MIDVAVAVIHRDSPNHKNKQFLIAKRHGLQHQGNKWEFPGGKIENGESVFQALQRELQEELGIEISDSLPLTTIKHQYADKTVVLHIHEVRQWEGSALDFTEKEEMPGKEGQPLRWVSREDLAGYEFPVANQLIIHLIQWGNQCLVTPSFDVSSSEKRDAFINKVIDALERDIRLVYLRQDSLDEKIYRQLIDILLPVFSSKQARLQVQLHKLNDELIHSIPIETAGIHLKSSQLMSGESLVEELPQKICVSASCHSLDEIRQAETLGCRFIFLSPVNKTGSHPEAMPLGMDGLKKLCEQTQLPVYALGGMNRIDLEAIRNAGGQGVAAISSLW